MVKIPNPNQSLNPNLLKVAKKDSARKAGEPKRMIFSFEHFLQDHKFGFKCEPPLLANWFVNAIDKLKLFSTYTVDEFFSPKTSRDLRVHKPAWSNSRVKMKEEDFRKKHMLGLEDEIFQIGLGKAMGRIIGYLRASDSVFYIVTADPMHNFHLSKESNFKERHSEPLDTFDKYANDVFDNLVTAKKILASCNKECEAKDRLGDIITGDVKLYINLMSYLSIEDKETLGRLPDDTLQDLFIEAIAHFLENCKNSLSKIEQESAVSNKKNV